jgi:APA family basic amino acid/polyamine antiporter
VAVSFTYGGYQQTINFGAEVKTPSKNIPRGIFLGIFIIILLYLTINYAYVKVIGYEDLRGARNIAAIMASKIFGVNAERILSGFLFLSVLAYVNVYADEQSPGHVCNELRTRSCRLYSRR